MGYLELLFDRLPVIAAAGVAAAALLTFVVGYTVGFGSSRPEALRRFFFFRVPRPRDLLADASTRGGTGARTLQTERGISEKDADEQPGDIELQHLPLPPPRGDLVVEDIAVMPPGSNTEVIHGVSLRVAVGEAIGIIGPSASGKSTLVRALIGEWHPIRGAVRLDGADIRQYERTELHRHIGYLPQDVELFDGTVAENIARWGDMNLDAVVQAARLAYVHDLILRLPQGYYTHVGEGGRNLSGSQRQRIGLARALYRNPSLVVLDQPDSNLDYDGGATLVEAIATLHRHTTVVVVSHKPSILNGMDKLLVLNGGMVEEFGPRAEIITGMSRPLGMSATGQASAEVLPWRRAGAKE